MMAGPIRNCVLISKLEASLGNSKKSGRTTVAAGCVVTGVCAL